MDQQLVKYIRTGVLAGLLVGITIANFLDYDKLWSCTIGLVGGALIGAVIGFIKRGKK